MMDYVMCELCHAFHVGTMYYISLCTTYYVMYELCLWLFPMSCISCKDNVLCFFVYYIMYELYVYVLCIYFETN
jgi:hypothetical protein